MMRDALEQAKVARNAAHAAFTAQIVLVREDLEARSIGGRVADRASEVMADAVDLASDHKGIIAGTIAGLAVWLGRRPIIRQVAKLWSEWTDNERKADDD